MEDKKEEEHRLAEEVRKLAEAAEGKMVEHKLEENKEEGEDKKEEEHRLAEEKGKMVENSLAEDRQVEGEEHRLAEEVRKLAEEVGTMVENSLAEDRLAEDKLAEVQDMLELQR